MHFNGGFLEGEDPSLPFFLYHKPKLDCETILYFVLEYYTFLLAQVIFSVRQLINYSKPPWKILDPSFHLWSDQFTHFNYAKLYSAKKFDSFYLYLSHIHCRMIMTKYRPSCPILTQQHPLLPCHTSFNFIIIILPRVLSAYMANNAKTWIIRTVDHD